MDVEKVLKELSLEEKANLCSGADMWHTQPIERMRVPSAMVSDGPNGLRKQEGEGDHLGLNESIKAVCFPTASALACSFDTDLLYALGETLGEECLSEDLAMLLGPGVNMKRSPLCGRNFEYFSEDPFLAGKLGSAYIRGLQSKGVAACVKHFAANNQEGYRMSGTSELDERTLHEIYLPAFEAAVKEGKTRAVMCAYNRVNGVFCAENKMLLTDILRGLWGFDGLVVTDWGAVKNRVTGLSAGLDLAMPGRDGMDVDAIVKAVKEGEIPENVLDTAVRNVLRFLADVGKREKRPPFDRKADQCKSGKIAEECAVLMKNNGVLPIEKKAKVAFIGEFAAVPRYQGGGSSHINSAFVTGALSAAEARGLAVAYARGYDAANDRASEEMLSEALSAAQEAEIAVVFAGLTDQYESEGFDRVSLVMPPYQNELIRRISAVQPNTIVVLHCGSCVEMPWFDSAAAVLCMHLAGDGAGEAAVSLLYGEVNPSGKLAETWPLRLQDNPSYLNFPGEEGRVEYREGIYIGYRYYDKKEMPVRLPFGFGLSYTSFAYSDLRLSAEKIADTDTLTVTCKIKNTGSRFGKEAVQLYVCDEQSTAGRPVRELKGFGKVALVPGEEKEIVFTLDKRSFAYYETKIHDWFVESGTFRIEIGASSRDIRLSAKVEVEGTAEIPVIFTPATPLGIVLRHPHGRAVVQAIRERRAAERGEDPGRPIEEGRNSGNMGAAEGEMVSHMIAEMPLSALLSLGGMQPAQLNLLIEMLNAQGKDQ